MTPRGFHRLLMIGMKTFGASAPLKELQPKFGFEPDRVLPVAKEVLGSDECCRL
jgi:transketolase